jgi:hypothetical protein
MRFILLSLVVLGLSALEDPEAKIATIQAEAETKTAALARAWLGKARLADVAVPAVDLNNATPKEAKAVDEARVINDRLKEARRILADKTCTDKNLAAFFNPGTIRAVLAAQALPAAKAHPGD